MQVEALEQETDEQSKQIKHFEKEICTRITGYCRAKASRLVFGPAIYQRKLKRKLK